MTGAALQIENLVSGYGEAMVLRGVSLTLSSGEVMAVLGKNGMGKTTLLNTIMGFLPVSSGSIRIFGTDTKGMSPHRRAALSVAYSPQDQPIFQELTVEENLRLGLRSDRVYTSAFERISDFFPVLRERRHQIAGTLSGGEQKMLIIARALLSRPRLMLIDEIAEGLQPSVLLRLAEVLLEELRASDLTILLIEQNMEFALAVADRYAVLAGGEIVRSGLASEPGIDARVHEHLAV
jgi:ABC-type branched-subunit amino acid transport system ATPase component